MDAIVTIISNVGYPIGVSVLLMVYIMKIHEQHKEETAQFTDALNKNTLVLQGLSDKLNEVIK